MLSRFRAHFRQQFVSYIAIFIALGGTSAYAANTVFSSDIVDGEVKTPDLGNGVVTGSKLAPDSVASGRVVDDSLGGSDINNNSLKGADIDEGSLSVVGGVRAYGRVSSSGTVSHAKGVSGNATIPSKGTYCLNIPGANPAQQPMVVGLELAGNNTNVITAKMSHVEWNSFGGGICPAGQYEVLTYFYDGDSVDDTDELTDQGGDILHPDYESFSFVVP